MIVSVAGEIVSVRFTFIVCAGEPESVTLNVSGVAFTATVGVPLIKPADEFSARPPGKVPEMSVQVYGEAPPAAVSVCEYDAPTWPFARAAVVIISDAEEIVSVRLALIVCAGELESVTLNVNAVALTAAVGVPLIKPVNEFSARPPGKVPEMRVQVYGAVPPVAVNVCEYDVPTWPIASDAVVIISDAEEIVSVRLTFAVCVDGVESVTLNASEVAFTALVGVPLITPVDDPSVKPLGNVPDTRVQV